MRSADQVPTRATWGMPVGVALLAGGAALALPVARWGDSSLALACLPVAVAGYLAGRRTGALMAEALTLSSVLLLSLPASFLLPGGAPLGDWLVSLLIALLTVVAPWWVGRYRRVRAEQRERDAVALAERAQAEERARIADDLHDTIGHELALIAVQAGALELARDVGSDQRARFRELREAAVRASDRLREVVQVTRSPGPGATEEPAVAIEELVTRAREAGVRVRHRIDGPTAAGLDPLGAELAVRVVREGLTNAVRHAPGADVEVSVTAAADDRVDVRIRTTPTDAGAPTDAGRPAAGAGTGISSLRRRAELLGGQLEVVGDADGAFELRLLAPRRSRPAPGTLVPSAAASNARAARRRILQAAAVPVVILGGVLGAFLVVQAVTVAQTALPSEVYDAIRVGQLRTEFARLLPAGIPEPPPVVVEPSVPEGADCEYFAARDGWLEFTATTYRLCFDRGVLVEKLELAAP